MMEYPGDVPPTPAERASLRLAASAAWLERIKAGGDPQHTASAEKHVAEQHQITLADAKKQIEAERKTHRCYVCGRSDLAAQSPCFRRLRQRASPSPATPIPHKASVAGPGVNHGERFNAITRGKAKKIEMHLRNSRKVHAIAGLTV